MSRLLSTLTTDSSVRFVVHNYTSSDKTTISGYELLTSGYSLIDTASTRSTNFQWENTEIIFPPKSTRITREFQYAQPPISISQKNTVRIYRDWGMPLDNNDDIFTLENLDDFESTDVTYLSFTRSALHTNLHEPRVIEKLDEGSLHDVIPQPHVHPSPLGKPPRPLSIPPYEKRKPIPISPHTLPFSPPEYSRCAWLIPIRGNLPWSGCTPANILDSASQIPHPTKRGAPISWTHWSLFSFWTFLLDLHASRSVGLIGLSFHASRSPSSSGSSFPRSEISALPPGIGQAASESHPFSGSGHTTALPATHRVLSVVDYIKVYHEAHNSMYLRNVFHIWGYTTNHPTSEGEKPGRIRVLKGARLALVDERSRGILML